MDENESSQTAGSKSPPAESEQIDLGTVCMIIVAANKLVGIQNISFQAVAENSAKDRQRHKRGCADAVIVFGGLGISFETKGLKKPPDVRSPNARCSIPRAVRQDDDFWAGHLSPSVYPRRCASRALEREFTTILAAGMTNTT